MAKGSTNGGAGGSGKSDIIVTAPTGSTVEVTAETKKNTASGENVQIADAANAPIGGLTIYGKSTQDGTPTPDSPVDIVSVGDDGSLVVTVSDSDTNIQTATLTTGLPLHGIPVSEGGNVTIDGQQYIADTLEVNVDGSGKVIKRCFSATYGGNAVNALAGAYDPNFKRCVIPAGTPIKPNAFTDGTGGRGLCNLLNKVRPTFNTHVMDVRNSWQTAGNNFYVAFNGTETLEEYKAKLNATPITFVCERETPLEIPLTAAEVQAILAMQTFSPVTNVYNDEGAYQEIGYWGTDGGVKRAAEKDGVWTFKGCDIGTWTVHASLGDQSATATVEIAEEDQRMRYYVTVAYFAATIAVTYPAGSICTCTKGTTVLTAPNTSGSYTFTVRESGDWVVSCTDGAKTKSQTVTITEDGQTTSVTLVYILYLYNAGDECESVTGGWVARDIKYDLNSGLSATPTVARNNDNITVSIPSAGWYQQGGLWTSKVIDVSSYDTLHFDCIGNGSGMDCFLNTDVGSICGENAVANLFFHNTSRTINTIDVSAITESVYVQFALSTYQNESPWLTLYSVYLT